MGLVCCPLTGCKSHVLVPQGKLALLWDGDTPLFLGPGRHCIWKPTVRASAPVSQNQSYIQHGPLHLIRVSMGQLGVGTTHKHSSSSDHISRAASRMPLSAAFTVSTLSEPAPSLVLPTLQLCPAAAACCANQHADGSRGSWSRPQAVLAWIPLLRFSRALLERCGRLQGKHNQGVPAAQSTSQPASPVSQPISQ